MTENIEPTPTSHKAIMEAAQMATLRYRSTSDASKAFVRHMETQIEAYEFSNDIRQKKRTVKEAANFSQTLAAFLADLIDHSGNVASHGYLYTPCRDDSFHNALASPSSFRAIKKALHEMGLIKTSNGFQTKGGKLSDNAVNRKANRYCGTLALLQEAERYGITTENLQDHFDVDDSKFIPLTLTTEKKWEGNKKVGGRRMKVPLDHPKVQTEIARMTALNEDLGQVTFNMGLRPNLFRAFGMSDHPDFDWNKGGRIYDWSKGSYQSFTKVQRSNITINGKEVCEIDVKASNPTIVYGLMGEAMDCDTDPYGHAEIPRDVMKNFTNAALSMGKPPVRTPKEVIEGYVETYGVPFPKNLNAKVLWQAVQENHPCFVRLEESGIGWGQLQYLESETMLMALEELNRSGIVALPIHDSLIVAKDDSKLAIEVLSRCFEKVCGIKPTLTIS